MDKGLKEKILKLKLEGKTYKEIGVILNCAKSSISYHCKKNGFGTEKIDTILIKEMNLFYQNHTLSETSKKFNLSKSTVKNYCKKRVLLSEEERKKNRVKSVYRRRKKIKQMAVEYKGGKCSCCDYDKYFGALEFHHLDPREKDFSISSSGHCRSWETVKKELDKCVLVCSNCHKEIHAGIIKF